VRKDQKDVHVQQGRSYKADLFGRNLNASTTEKLPAMRRNLGEKSLDRVGKARSPAERPAGVTVSGFLRRSPDPRSGKYPLGRTKMITTVISRVIKESGKKELWLQLAGLVVLLKSHAETKLI